MAYLFQDLVNKTIESTNSSGLTNPLESTNSSGLTNPLKSTNSSGLTNPLESTIMLETNVLNTDKKEELTGLNKLFTFKNCYGLNSISKHITINIIFLTILPILLYLFNSIFIVKMSSLLIINSYIDYDMKYIDIIDKMKNLNISYNIIIIILNIIIIILYNKQTNENKNIFKKFSILLVIILLIITILFSYNYIKYIYQLEYINDNNIDSTIEILLINLKIFNIIFSLMCIINILFMIYYLLKKDDNINITVE